MMKRRRRMLNVGVIGAGYIGKVHLEALSRLGGVSVTSVADVNRDQAREYAESYGIDFVTKDYREILDDSRIDVIHNCTPNKFHYQISREALMKGKYVLSEKPLSMKLEEAEDLVNLSEKKNIVTGVHFCYRYYPLVQEISSRIKNNNAGEIRMVTGTWFQDWLSKDTDYSWRLERGESGNSNITADLGSHWFDLIQFVTGLKVKEVFGDMKTIIPKRKKPKRQVLAFENVSDQEYEEVRMELEEYSAVLFHLSNDAPGSFTTSQVCNGRKSNTEFQIYGEKSSLAWDHGRPNELWIGNRDTANEILIESPVLQQEDTQKWSTLPAGHPMGYHDAVLNMFKDFYSAVESATPVGKAAHPNFRTGYEQMKILDAIVKSVRERTWVKVDW